MPGRSYNPGELFPIVIAHIVFWGVLLIAHHELGSRRCGLFILLWVIGWFGARWLPSGEVLFASFAAILDIPLVLAAFQGDLKLR